jgi:predicted Kef-type K+ transport protein
LWGDILFLVYDINLPGFLVNYVLVAAAQVLSTHAARWDCLLDLCRSLRSHALCLFIIRCFLDRLLLSVHCGHLLLGILISHLLFIVLDLFLCQLRLLVEFDDTDETDQANDSDDSSDSSSTGGFRKLCRIACLNIVALTGDDVPEPTDIWQH